MTRSAKLENQFVGDGYYDLCLRIGELITLQEILNVGPYVLAQRFLSGEWLVQDVAEVIRLALIGGGMDQRKAFDHVKQNVVEGHFLEYAGLAGNVVFASISGVEDEDVPGEATAPTTMEKHDH